MIVVVMLRLMVNVLMVDVIMVMCHATLRVGVGIMWLLMQLIV